VRSRTRTSAPTVVGCATHSAAPEPRAEDAEARSHRRDFTLDGFRARRGTFHFIVAPSDDGGEERLLFYRRHGVGIPGSGPARAPHEGRRRATSQGGVGPRVGSPPSKFDDVRTS